MAGCYCQMNQDEEQQAYRELSPDAILDAVEREGMRCSGHLFALNSYENRVYQVGLEGGTYCVVKFYRPRRWSDGAILEEHAFVDELVAHDIHAVAALRNAREESLHRHGLFRYAIYPRHGGRPVEPDNTEHLKRLGRLIGRIHAVGAVSAFAERPRLEIESFGVASYEYLLDHGFIPSHVEHAYRTLAEDLITGIEGCYERAGNFAWIRVHGDCHPGNILLDEDGPWLLDFDDARTAPAVQDLWMFLSGDRAYRTARLADLLAGYTEFYDFNPRELHLIEALRTLRIMHYAAWIAKRWTDPAFPRAFPWFGSSRFWEEHILTLREQAAALSEEPLVWHGSVGGL